MSPDRPRLQSLGGFLRSRRTATPPASLGLAPGRRRRTPGLRREELAQACGISTTWYTWLEQGRPISVSPQALARLADALHLAPAERRYLFDLAEKRDPRLPAAGLAEAAPQDLAAAVAAMGVPAYALDSAWTAAAWNEAAARLFVGWLDGAHDRNLLRFVFLAPGAKKLIADWDERAERLVAEFRAEMSRAAEDPVTAALIAELRKRSVIFDQLWRRQTVLEREGGLRRFRHPETGRCTFQQVSFVYAPRPAFKMVMLLPA